MTTLNRYNPKTVHIVSDMDVSAACRLADRIVRITRGRVEPVEVRHELLSGTTTVICRCTAAEQPELEKLLRP